MKYSLKIDQDGISREEMQKLLGELLQKFKEFSPDMDVGFDNGDQLIIFTGVYVERHFGDNIHLTTKDTE